MATPHPLRLSDFRWAFLLVALSWVAGVWLFTQVPEQVPVHWNAAGEVDRYGSRIEGTLVVPAVGTGLVLLLAFVPRIDPRERNYGRFRKAYLGLVYATLLFLLGVQAFTAIEMLAGPGGSGLDVGRFVTASMGLLLVALGFLLPRLEPNWFAGIRTPWTLEDERVWKENHAFGGKAFVAMGIVVALAGLFTPPPWNVWILLVTILAGTVVVIAQGYFVYRRLHRRP